jgi:hypothetical protein
MWDVYKICEECYHYSEWANDQNKSCSSSKVIELCSWTIFIWITFVEVKYVWIFEIWKFEFFKQPQMEKLSIWKL